MRQHLALAAAIALLSACVDMPPQEENPQRSGVASNEASTFVYHCDPGLRFVARLEGQRVWLFLPDRTIDLPRVPAASGVRYADAETVFWEKGGEAMLELGDRRYLGCRNDRRAAIWEHARLNGVSFRAVGNEPPWILEIYDGDRIDLRTGYEGHRHRFTNVLIDDDPVARVTRYRAREDDKEIRVRLSARGCRDTMSDESFETQVTVRFGGRELHGCGRPLH
jgi:putative lipoprotein